MRKRYIPILLFASVCTMLLMVCAYLLVGEVSAGLNSVFRPGETVQQTAERLFIELSCKLYDIEPEDLFVDEPEEELVNIEVSQDDYEIGEEFTYYDWDKTAEWGVFSTSCQDLNLYLDEDGEMPEWMHIESGFETEYSGRWLYPVLLNSRFFTDGNLTDKSDYSEMFYCSDSETDADVIVAIYSGLNLYHTEWSYYEQVGSNDYLYHVGCHLNDGGDVYVLVRTKTERNYQDETKLDRLTHYIFNVGNFSVRVSTNNDEVLTADEIGVLVNSFLLIS